MNALEERPRAASAPGKGAAGASLLLENLLAEQGRLETAVTQFSEWHDEEHLMAGHYRQRIDDDRLRRVTDYVRNWLFAEPAEQPLQPGELRIVG